ncbi:MAG: CpaF family protein [Proteobacteria bacterium]|nr:CpaF family protein [Pseudomonadota bacterium]
MDVTPEFISAVQGELVAALDLRRNDIAGMHDGQLRALAQRCIADIVARHALPSGIDRQGIERQLLQEAVGRGVLEDLLSDDSVTEIMVNGPNSVFIERAGRLAPAPVRFSSARALSRVIERLLSDSGRRVDEGMPMVDARLADGSRLNVIIGPLALNGPALTIRKFARHALKLEDLIERGALSVQMAALLSHAVHHRRNIVVSGGTGSGKTTLLNVLSALIPETERVVTIEDSAELQLQHPNRVILQARPSNLEGQGTVTIRDLVRNALRMRPDRIVIGECRGAEALDMLQAMNTGHNGSLTTAHANTPRDLLSRLEVMVLMAGMELPVQAIREQMASAVNLIVQQARFACGARRIVSITEITGIEGGRVQMQDLFRFQQTGVDAEGRSQGHFVGCGNLPVYLEGSNCHGLDRGLFDRRVL